MDVDHAAATRCRVPPERREVLLMVKDLVKELLDGPAVLVSEVVF
jgi:hypothetical protein